MSGPDVERMTDPAEVIGSSAVSINFAERFLVAFDPEYSSEDMPYQSQAHVRFQNALRAALQDAGLAIGPGWQPIETAPPLGTVAVLYFPQERDDEFDGLDYRYQLAIYRRTPLGDGWHDQGTNHDSFEGPDMKGDYIATHWMPLPNPPAPSSR